MNSTDYKTYVAQYYDQDADDYELRYWSNPALQQIRQSFREVVKSYPATTMLEVGCGTGLDIVHFAKNHPDRKLSGLDISPEMIRLSAARSAKQESVNVELKVGSAEEAGLLFSGRKFDLIYVFFGALNTVEDLNKAAQALSDILNPGGTMVITFVNKWYLEGVVLDLARLRLRKAFARFKPIWGGYSAQKYLPSHCYTPRQVEKAFEKLKMIQHKGYSILHPAWFYTNINKILGRRLLRILWKTDNILNRTPLRRFGEYGLLVFQRN